MKPESISHLPTVPLFSPEKFKAAHEEFVVAFDQAKKTHAEKAEEKKKRKEKTKAFVERVAKDPAFRAKTEARRALIGELETILNGMPLDSEQRAPILIALWKSAEDPDYARELFEKALFFANEHLSIREKADVWERVKSLPKERLIDGLMKAIELEPNKELGEKHRMDETAKRLEEEYGYGKENGKKNAA